MNTKTQLKQLTETVGQKVHFNVRNNDFKFLSKLEYAHKDFETLILNKRESKRLTAIKNKYGAN